MQYSHHQHESFNDVATDAMKGAPWILLSAVAHLVLGMVLFLFSGDEVQPVPPVTVTAQLDDATEMEEPPEEIVEPDIPVDPEVEKEHPDPAPDLHDEDNTDQETEETAAHEDLAEATDMDSVNLHDVIGTGGTPSGGIKGGGGGRDLRGGGSPPRSNFAVDRGLEWLARHQSKKGFWDGDEYMKEGDPKLGPLCDGKGGPLHDVGLTGLSLLAFLGAGETHSSGAYKKNVRSAIKWLREQQDSDGCFGARNSHYTYDHAIATLAMCEAYWMTSSPLLRKPAEDGVAYIIRCQNPYEAWRYGEADGQNDTSVTGWMVMALKSAKLAGIPVDPRHIKWAASFIDEMTDEDTGRCGYTSAGSLPVREDDKQQEFPANEVESLTAVGVLTRIFAGQDPSEQKAIKQGVDLMSEKLPSWDETSGGIDMYYWYYGTLAMYQVGGHDWTRWNKAMTSAIIDTQRPAVGKKIDNFTGSWDPKGPWGESGGRVYSTAMMTLCLEVYYRYGRVFGTR